LTVVVPLDGGNCHPFTRPAMQRESPGYPFGSPGVLTSLTDPLGATVTLTTTRAEVGAFGSRASSAGCQHVRFTLLV
jgi:hypothetical protein